MPSLDDRDQVVGHVLRELQSGNYVRTFLVLNFENHKLLGYPGNTMSARDVREVKPVIEINCQWITKVSNASSRPRVLHCLQIGLPTGSQYLSVDSDEERDEWAESIRRCSMGQGSSCGKPVEVGSQPMKDKHVAYQNRVVGGKVQKFPIQSNGSAAAESTVLGGRCWSESRGGRRTRGFPRVINAGHGIKLGAVMKNWKKRFFVLTEVSLGYYKSIEEAEPIRTISVGDMTGCGPSKEFSGKEKEHMFELATPSRTYYIQVESEEEVEEWVESLRGLISTVRGSHQPLPHSSDSTQDSTSDEDVDIVGTLV